MSAFMSIPVLAGSVRNAFDVAEIEVSDIASLYQFVFFISSQGNFENKDFVFRSTTTAASLGINLPRLLFLPHDVIRIAVSAISVIDLIYFINVFLLMIKAIEGNP